MPRSVVSMPALVLEPLRPQRSWLCRSSAWPRLLWKRANTAPILSRHHHLLDTLFHRFVRLAECVTDSEDVVVVVDDENRDCLIANLPRLRHQDAAAPAARPQALAPHPDTEADFRSFQKLGLLACPSQELSVPQSLTSSPSAVSRYPVAGEADSSPQQSQLSQRQSRSCLIKLLLLPPSLSPAVAAPPRRLHPHRPVVRGSKQSLPCQE